MMQHWNPDRHSCIYRFTCIYRFPFSRLAATEFTYKMLLNDRWTKYLSVYKPGKMIINVKLNVTTKYSTVAMEVLAWRKGASSKRILHENSPWKFNT